MRVIDPGDEPLYCKLVINLRSAIKKRWGCAIDLNAADNPLGSEGDWSHDFITVMEHVGIYCGSRWPGRPDPMHFALVNG